MVERWGSGATGRIINSGNGCGGSGGGGWRASNAEWLAGRAVPSRRIPGAIAWPDRQCAMQRLSSGNQTPGGNGNNRQTSGKAKTPTPAADAKRKKAQNGGGGRKRRAKPGANKPGKTAKRIGRQPSGGGKAAERQTAMQTLASITQNKPKTYQSAARPGKPGAPGWTGTVMDWRNWLDGSRIGK